MGVEGFWYVEGDCKWYDTGLICQSTLKGSINHGHNIFDGFGESNHLVLLPLSTHLTREQRDFYPVFQVVQISYITTPGCSVCTLERFPESSALPELQIDI